MMGDISHHDELSRDETLNFSFDGRQLRLARSVFLRGKADRTIKTNVDT